MRLLIWKLTLTFKLLYGMNRDCAWCRHIIRSIGMLLMCLLIHCEIICHYGETLLFFRPPQQFSHDECQTEFGLT